MVELKLYRRNSFKLDARAIKLFQMRFNRGVRQCRQRCTRLKIITSLIRKRLMVFLFFLLNYIDNEQIPVSIRIHTLIHIKTFKRDFSFSIASNTINFAMSGDYYNYVK